MFNFVNMKEQALQDYLQDSIYHDLKYSSISGRYLPIKKLENYISQSEFHFIEIGRSVEERPVYKTELGTGSVKILAWSQMHGNESTTTKAVFDLLEFFRRYSDSELVKMLLKSFTIEIIPMLNPDGAEAYTRVNANEVDLNRDLQELSQPESQVLMRRFKSFKPDFCLNLHDQRTIFSSGDLKKPATLSFLTPSSDEDRSITEARKTSMGLIAAMVSEIKNELNGQIGRYDDGFNLNCAGDTFQSHQVPTILFEAGHFANDYGREITRKFIFKALLSCLYHIAVKTDLKSVHENYFSIRENQKLFNDVVIRNYNFGKSSYDIAIQYRETKNSDQIDFVPVIEKISKKISNFGHQEFDAETEQIQILSEDNLAENVVVNKIIINKQDLVVK